MSRRQPQQADTGATLDWNASPAWSITALLPYVNREHFHIHNPQGQKIEDRWKLRGVGDMKVLALSAVLAKRFGVGVARPLAPSFPTLGDVDSVEALHEYQAAKRAHRSARRQGVAKA